MFSIYFTHRTSGNYSSDENDDGEDSDVDIAEGDVYVMSEYNMATTNNISSQVDGSGNISQSTEMDIPSSSERITAKRKRISHKRKLKDEEKPVSSEVIAYLKRKEERELKENECRNGGRNEDDPDVNFVMSLLGDIRSMTPRQKRLFKIKVWQCIDEVQGSNQMQGMAEHRFSTPNHVEMANGGSHSISNNEIPHQSYSFENTYLNL